LITWRFEQSAQGPLCLEVKTHRRPVAVDTIAGQLFGISVKVVLVLTHVPYLQWVNSTYRGMSAGSLLMVEELP